jgi:hypothetical protein
MTVKHRHSQAREPRPVLRAVPRADEARVPDPSPRLRPVRPQVVAEVLSDGTVRQVGERARPPVGDFEAGRISGEGWMLWWERRRLD